MTDQPLRKEFEYFLAHKDELANKYNGKFIVIKDEQVISSHNTEEEAVIAGNRRFQKGTFLVQACRPGSDVYTQTFHSRVTI